MPTIRGFKSSGKIGYIENKKLKKLILAYYQKEIPALIDVENYYNTRLVQMVDGIIELADKSTRELLLNPKINMRLSMVLNSARGGEKAYEKTIKERMRLLPK